MMKKTIFIATTILLSSLSTNAQRVTCKTSPETGAITNIGISGDRYNMNWILSPDYTQYNWIGPNDGWGLGYATFGNKKLSWNKPTEFSSNRVVYTVGDSLRLTVSRRFKGDNLIEEYHFLNITGKPLKVDYVEIKTPFNDNYPGAEICITQRTNAHVWPGGNAAYVCALRMGGTAPHLGLVLTKGSITGYSESNVSRQHGMSNFRGVIALISEGFTLKPGKEYVLSWELFSHNGKEDFKKKMIALGGALVSSDNYVYKVGETANIKVIDRKGTHTINHVVDKTGDNIVEIPLGQGKTYAELFGMSSAENLIERRADFIIDHQQVHKVGDPRYGAFLPYDNEADTMYLDFKHKNRRSDMDEGAERVGMGVFLALEYQRKPTAKVRKALDDYAYFLRNKLQYDGYKTSQRVEHTGRNRAYNYPWIAEFYIEMYNITGEKHFVVDAYGTMRSLYSQFGHDFYAIGTPAIKTVKALRKIGMTAQADTLLQDYRLLADAYVANGVTFPKSEVAYEQSIVAPSIVHCLQVYLLTGEKKYLDFARETIPVLDAFNGFQASCHLNDIAIRHWDGYWFGKEQMWGDTFPHYWSCITAAAFGLYAQATDDHTYLDRAKAIVTNNLCQFREDGRGSCAFIYPTFVNGVKGHHADPMANDQDWALAYYLEWINQTLK